MSTEFHYEPKFNHQAGGRFFLAFSGDLSGPDDKKKELAAAIRAKVPELPEVKKLSNIRAEIERKQVLLAESKEALPRNEERYEEAFSESAESAQQYMDLVRLLRRDIQEHSEEITRLTELARRTYDDAVRAISKLASEEQAPLVAAAKKSVAEVEQEMPQLAALAKRYFAAHADRAAVMSFYVGVEAPNAPSSIPLASMLGAYPELPTSNEPQEVFVKTAPLLNPGMRGELDMGSTWGTPERQA